MINRVCENIMLFTVAAVYFMGLIASLIIPFQLFHRGDIGGGIAMGMFSAFIWICLGSFYLLGRKERKDEQCNS